MRNSSELEKVQVSLGKLTLRLFTALICSALLPAGYLITKLANGFVVFGGGGNIDPFWLTVGIIFLAGGPIILALLFKPTRGGLVVGITGAIWILLMHLIYDLGLYPPLLPLTLNFQLGIMATGTLLILFLARRPVNHIEFIGLILGLLTGYLLEIFVRLSPAWEGDRYGILLPFLWINTIFFPDLLNRRVGWQGVLVWLAFLYISYLVSLTTQRIPLIS